jgi:putative ABC transport system permease protein
MFRFALANLLSRPLRTLLSTLGLAIAIGGMVGLLAIAGGIDVVVQKTFRQIPGLLVQQRGAPIPLFSSLPAEWEAELLDLEGIAVVDPQVVARVNELEGETVLSPPRFLVGTTVAARSRLQRDVYRDNLLDGRSLDGRDAHSNACVISSRIAESHGKQVGDPLWVNRFECRIAGVYRTGSLMLDGNIVMDINTVRRLARISPETVCAFYVEPADDAETEQLQDRIVEQFRDRDLNAPALPSWLRSFPEGLQSPRSLADAVRLLDAELKATSKQAPNENERSPNRKTQASSPIEVRSPEDWADRFQEFTADLNIFLTLLTLVGVLIAVLGIVNTMVMNVNERTTEFGILRANGWSQGEVMRLMTIEAALLGLAGGVLGSLVGWLATWVVNGIWEDRIHLHAGPQLLLSALLCSILLGILGGLYPAWAAARLSPMETIRRG